MFLRSSHRHGAWFFLLAIVAVSFVACSDDDPTAQPEPLSDFDIVLENGADVVTVSWDAQTNVDSFKVEIL